MDELISLIYAANGLLCLLFGMHIVSQGRYRTIATKILGVDYLVYALQYALGVAIFYWQWEPAFYLRPVIAMLIGPGYYFYYYSLVNPRSLWKLRHFLHFIPSMLMVYALFMGGAGLINIEYLILCSFLVYTLLVLSIVTKGVSQLKHLASDAKNAFRWLRVLAVLIVISTVTEFSIYFEMQGSTKLTSSKSLLVGSSVFLIFNAAVILLSLKQAPIIDWMFMVVESSFGRYKGSALDDERRVEIYKRWETLVEQKEIYKQEGGVALRDVAKMLDVPARHLSESINSCYQGSFSQYLNDCRVRKVQRMLLKDPASSITKLMYEAGFSSKSGFNKEFLRVAGVSPSEYRKQCLSKD